MKKLYEKNEPAFAPVWIVVYAAGTSPAETLSDPAGRGGILIQIF